MSCFPRNVRRLNEKLPILEKMVANATRAYEAGNIDSLTYVNMANTLLNQRLEAVDLEQSLWEIRIALDTLLAWPDEASLSSPWRSPTMICFVRHAKFCLLFAMLVFFPATRPALAEPQAQVQTLPLAEHNLKMTVVAYGQVQADPDHISSISLPRAGSINRLLVRLGQRVAANQELLELDTAPQARMDYQQAKAAVDYARSKLQQTQSLFSQQLATRDQVAGAQRDLRDAEAKLAALVKLGSGKKMTIIRAPFAGIVTELKVSQGQRVQADTGAMLLASGDTLIVPLGVEPEDARRIEPGMKVVLESLFEQHWRVEVQVGHCSGHG